MITLPCCKNKEKILLFNGTENVERQLLISISDVRELNGT